MRVAERERVSRKTVLSAGVSRERARLAWWRGCVAGIGLAVALGVAATAAFAHESQHGATVRSVYDSDTIRADIMLGLDLVLRNQPIRIEGLDTPEIQGRCAREQAFAREARDRLRELPLGGETTLELHGENRYGRTLAVVRVDGCDVAEPLIAEGLARPYDGGRREGWC